MKNSTIVRFFLLIFLLSAASPGIAQDTKYVRKHLIKLCGPEMHGRGYYKRGDSIAAFYMADEFKRMGVQAFPEGYIQRYNFNVNVVNEVMVRIDGQELVFNHDYVVGPYTGSAKGTFRPVILNASLMNDPDKFLTTLQETPSPKAVLLDSAGLRNPGLFRFIKDLALNGQFGISAVIEVCANTPGTYPGRRQEKVAHVLVGRKAVPASPEKLELNIVADYTDNYPTQNVIGFLPGQTDQYIVFTAHYDGYGSYGEGNYNPAAEDNGSGTAMVMDLARHYLAGKKPYYSVAFMLFSGEEVGLMGSKNYVANPMFPLDKIKLVINLDMVMTGQDGVFLFNGNGRPNEAAIVQKINEEHKYMKSIDLRDGTANSDHFPFQEKGVPAIFFLTKGASGRGHGPDDTYDKLPLYAYENLFKLVIAIPEELRKQ
jgi:aminopeptidase YwaD